MTIPYTIDLRLGTSDGLVRAVAGARRDIDRSRLRLPPEDTSRDDVLADVGAGPAWPAPPDEPHPVGHWELEIGEAGPALSPSLRRAVGQLLPADVVDELVDLAGALVDEPLPWHAEWVPGVGPALTEQGASWFDLTLPTVNWRQGDCTADPVVSYRRARLIWTPTWCVTVWGPRSDDEESRYGTWGLPDRPLPPPTVPDGPELLTAMVRAVAAHLEWAVDMLDLELECWENDFLAQAAEKGVLTGPDLDRLQRHLARLGSGIAMNREAVRTLVRRGEVLPHLPSDVRGLIVARAPALTQRCQQQREAVRESFDLIASASAGQQLRLAQERAERDGAFQTVVGILAAVLVAPGLVAAFYGANVKGLPGYDTESGLWFMLAGALGAACVSLGLVVGVRAHSRRQRS